MAESFPNTVRFGSFEADLTTHELRKFGRKVRLPNQSFLVLRVLLERPRQLVTREELRGLLWPEDTFVEYDQGLNAAVNRLRDALGDSSEQPRFIETLPKRGYRFIAEVECSSTIPGREVETREASMQVPAMEGADAALQKNEQIRPSRRLRSIFILLIVALALIITISVGMRLTKQDSSASVRLVPFTTFPGQEVAPSFSPDGSQIAFGWKTEPKGGFDLYVKAVGSETTVRLTKRPARWISPAWSPSGTEIAFARWSDDAEANGIFVVPALGGPERKLLDTSFWYPPFMQISWSPDGKALAFRSSGAGRANISAVAVDTLKTRILSPASECWDAGAPTFSPDGTRVAFVCTSSIAVYKILVAPLTGGPPTVSASMMGYPLGLTWSGDGARIIFSNDSGQGGELWQAEPAHGLARLQFGDHAAGPAIALRGNRLAFASGWKNTNIWRVDLYAHDRENSAVKLISSSKMQSLPQYSPDGSKILFQSNRSGANEIWLVAADGTNPTQLTTFNGPQTGSPTWCSDGQRIAFDSRASGLSAVYMEDIRERVPRSIRSDIENLALPTWSDDCKWLFASDGHDALYQLPAEGGNAVRVTNHPSWFSLVRHGLLYFNVKKSEGVRLWSKPLNGGEEMPVKGIPELAYTESWTVGPRGVYYTDSASNPATIKFFDFDTQTVRTVLRLSQRPGPDDGLTVSPDGRWLLYGQVDDEQSDIMMAEHFR